MRNASLYKPNCNPTHNADTCDCEDGYIRNTTDFNCVKLPDLCIATDVHATGASNSIVNNEVIC
jgi:hypothetical protein